MFTRWLSSSRLVCLVIVLAWCVSIGTARTLLGLPTNFDKGSTAIIVSEVLEGPGMTSTLTEDVEPLSLNLVYGVLATLAITWAVFYRLKRRRLYELADKIPGPKGWPLIGNALQLTGDPHKIFKEIYSQTEIFQDVIKMWIGPRLMIFLSHPADIELILSSSEHIEKSQEYGFFEPWLGDALLIAPGDVWRPHRRVIAPTFHLNILKSFFPQFNKNAEETVRRLSVHAGTGAEFDIHKVMGPAAVETLLETVMGVDKNTQDNGSNYSAAVEKICEIVHIRQVKLWLKSNIIFSLTSYKKNQNHLLDIIHGFTKKVIKVRKANYIRNGRRLPGNALEEETPMKKLPADAGVDQMKGTETTEISKTAPGEKVDLGMEGREEKKQRLAFLDYMIHSSENGVMLTDLEIQNQVDGIMFGGHDAVTAAASFFLCLMAQRQDIQKKVQTELHEIFGGSNRAVTFEDTLEMRYLERCIMEALRLYAPVPVIGRKLNQELKLASRGLTLPADCTVIIAPFWLHRRADFYPEPETFDPDRFLPTASAGRHLFSYIPFSGGPRSCVGRKYALLKLKVFLATLLRHFEFYGGRPESDWQLRADIILKRSDGFPLCLRKRGLSLQG